LFAGRSGSLAILAYHRVFDLEGQEDFPYDPELVSASVAEFAWQMETVRRHFRPVHLAQALRDLEEGRPLPSRAVAVTFDDGHRDNYTNAFPVLRRVGVPATIFLSTGYMDREETFWFDEVAFRLHRTPRRELELSTLGLRVMLGSGGERRRATEDVLERLKVVPNTQRLAALRELAAESGVDGTGGDARSRPLTWEQVREMRDGGVEFGSHTVSHPILSRLGDEELRVELEGSRLDLERELGRPVECLAYPVGGETAYDERVVEVARACGYRLGLSYVSGVNPWPPRDRYRLRRLHVERYTTRARFSGMLAFPGLFG
jgi:peptidoglycan/xylan/chitin deacetylase (PgdA/CDA1 family)